MVPYLSLAPGSNTTPFSACLGLPALQPLSTEVSNTARGLYLRPAAWFTSSRVRLCGLFFGQSSRTDPWFQREPPIFPNIWCCGKKDEKIWLLQRHGRRGGLGAWWVPSADFSPGIGVTAKLPMGRRNSPISNMQTGEPAWPLPLGAGTDELSPV
jgi:hypothetical protein